MLQVIKSAHALGKNFFDSTVVGLLTLLPAFVYTPKGNGIEESLRSAHSWDHFKSILKKHYPKWSRFSEITSKLLSPLSALVGAVLLPLTLLIRALNKRFADRNQHIVADVLSVFAVRKAIMYIGVGVSALFLGIAGGLVAIEMAKVGAASTIGGVVNFVFSQFSFVFIGNAMFAAFKAFSSYRAVQVLSSEQNALALNKMSEKDKTYLFNNPGGVPSKGERIFVKAQILAQQKKQPNEDNENVVAEPEVSRLDRAGAHIVHV